jgi:hypothetical protein
MKTIYFKLNGRFGNNIFQYFASEIIKKIYNFNEIKIYNNEQNIREIIVIDDVLFKKIGTEYIKGNFSIVYSLINTEKDILMDGYFQRSEIFYYFREYLFNIFNKDNKSLINNSYSISDIVNHNMSHYIIPEENDLIVHLRLDDFIGDLQIFDPEQIIEIINKIKYENLYIVCDNIKKDWEFKYISKFNSLNPMFISYSMLDDFNFMRKAKKILVSASTFSWLAAFLGNANEIHIPYNNFHGGEENNGQNLGKFNEKCIVYKNVKYWDKK